MTAAEFAAQHGDRPWTSADIETELNLADIDHLPTTVTCWFCGSDDNPSTATTCGFCNHRFDDAPAPQPTA